MPLQNFVARGLPAISAVWLNGVDALKFTIFGDSTTKAAARAALTSDLPFSIGQGGTGATTVAGARTALEIGTALVYYGTDAGAANAAVVTLSGPVTGFTRATGEMVTFKAAAANTGATTLNVNGTGAAAVVNENAAALTGGELSFEVTVQWNGTAWKIIRGLISADLARTAAETSAAVVPVNYLVNPKTQSVLRYGTNTTPGTTDMTQAFINCRAVNGGSWYAPAGTYSIDNTAIAYTGTAVGIVGRGDGALSTILKQRATTGNVIGFGTGGSYHTLLFKDFKIEGHASSSSGAGFFIHNTLAQEVFALRLENLWITDMGGSGVDLEGQTFDTTLFNVLVDNCDDHLFDIDGGNALTLIQCYALNVLGANKAGFRIRSGNPTFIGCTGINSGDYWAILASTVADDGADRNCHATLINCNVEDFEVVGIQNKRGGVTLVNTAFFSPSSGTVKALLLNPSLTSLIGPLDSGTSFDLKGSGAWSNSLPVHTSANGIPFSFVASEAADTFTWRNENIGADQSTSTYRQVQYRSNVSAVSPLHFYERGYHRSKYSGTNTLSGGTGTVTLSPAMPDTTYNISLCGGANETFWVAPGDKTVNNFVIRSSNAASTASVDWSVRLNG